MFIKRVAAAFAFLLASQAAHAAIIEHGAYFTDTTSGLDWLKNSPLAGQSYNSVLHGFGGYTNSGWRFATGSELWSFVTTYVNPLSARASAASETYNETQTDSAFNSAYSLIQLLGVNVSWNTPSIPGTYSVLTNQGFTGLNTQAFYDDESTTAGIFNLAAYDFSSSRSAFTQIIPNFVSRDYLFGTNVSSVLVRSISSEQDSVVAEPGSCVLLLTALGLLGFTRRNGASA